MTGDKPIEEPFAKVRELEARREANRKVYQELLEKVRLDAHRQGPLLGSRYYHHAF